MAAKKKKKVKKAAKTRKAPARKKKTVAKKAKGPAHKAKKVAAKKKTPAKAKKKAPARKPAKKTKKKQTVGEGDYQASRSFLKDQSGFVEKNRDRIPAMGHAAEKALEGPEGDSLRDAEAAAASRSRDTF